MIIQFHSVAEMDVTVETAGPTAWIDYRDKGTGVVVSAFFDREQVRKIVETFSPWLAKQDGEARADASAAGQLASDREAIPKINP